MDLLDDAREARADLIGLRRRLHGVPEIGLQLPRTQELVLAALDDLPLEVSTGHTCSSVTAVLRGTSPRAPDAPDSSVLLRADMDALPIAERTGLDFAARNGAMHACGHDLHASALVGAARLLSERRERLAGDVVFMFQPGEEGWNGAGEMIEDGVLDAAGTRVRQAYGLHVFAHQRRGIVHSRPGTLMAAAHGLFVTVRGAGGHGAVPHLAKDPVAAMAQMIVSLQTMITRRFDVFDPVVLTVGVVRAGTLRNVISSSASFEATIRSYSHQARAQLETLVPEVLPGIASAHGLEVEIELRYEFPPTVNTPDEVEYGAGVVAELFGEHRYASMPNPLSGSEDFARVLEQVPGAFFGIGARPEHLDPASAPMNHSAEVDFDEAVLPEAAALYAGLAIGRLQGRSEESRR